MQIVNPCYKFTIQFKSNTFESKQDFMAYDITLADKVSANLYTFDSLEIEEKKMFRGLTFMVNGEMCVCVSGEKLMCRFDPALYEEVAEKKGFAPMIMKGKELKGYCYVEPTGFQNKKDFYYWINLCIAFDERAKSSKKKG